MSANEQRTAADDLHLVIKANDAAAQLTELASELLERRESILDAWRAAGDAGPGGSIASSLSRAQFNDHIPAVLDCLASTLRVVARGTGCGSSGAAGGSRLRARSAAVAAGISAARIDRRVGLPAGLRRR